MRSFTRQRQQEHNVGGYGPLNIGGMAGMPFNGWGNVGEVAGQWNEVGNPPAPPAGIDPALWMAIFRRFGMLGCAKLCNLSGGTPGLGFGGMCPAPNPPAIPVGADGCSKGWLQCKQPIAVSSLAVGAGATATITVTPRRVMRATQLHYAGPATTFLIASLNVDGTEYIGSSTGIAADRYAAAVTDHSIDIGEFSSTTPLIVQVTNFTGAAADFRAVLDGASARS